MDWLLQNLFSSLVWEIILLLGGGLVLAYLKRTWPEIAAQVMYGLVGAALLSVLLFTLTGHSILFKQQPETTTENVEANIKAWADSLGVGIPRVTVPDTYFSEVITLKNGNQIVVARAKERGGYLQIQSTLVLAPEHQAILAKLTREQVADVTEEVTLELARARMGYTISGPQGGYQMQNIFLQRSVPITNNLTEATFGGYMDEMDSAIALVKLATTLALAHNSPLPHVAVTPHIVQQ
jgi:hypothetical protein